MNGPDIAHIDIAEFRKLGYLHEVNRLLLHPLGLALEVNTVIEPARKLALSERDAQELEQQLVNFHTLSTGQATALLDALRRGVRVESGEELGGVWDCRDDPEGVTYGDDLLDAQKAERVAEQMLVRRKERKELTGFVVQPVETERPTLTTTYLDQAGRTGGTRPESFPGSGDVEFER